MGLLHFCITNDLESEKHVTDCADVFLFFPQTDDHGDINKEKLIEYIAAKAPHLEKSQFEPVVALCSQRSKFNNTAFSLICS